MEYVRMSREHVPQIAQLESLCFSSPWSERSIESELTNPLALWIVAVDNNRVAGYVGSQSVMGEADMMNLAVDSDFRRMGIGQKLVEKLVESLTDNAVHSLTLEVRASNESAISLYEKLQFHQVGRRPGYYSGPKEDALILRKEWAV